METWYSWIQVERSSPLTVSWCRPTHSLTPLVVVVEVAVVVVVVVVVICDIIPLKVIQLCFTLAWIVAIVEQERGPPSM